MQIVSPSTVLTPIFYHSLISSYASYLTIEPFNHSPPPSSRGVIASVLACGEGRRLRSGLQSGEALEKTSTEVYLSHRALCLAHVCVSTPFRLSIQTLAGDLSGDLLRNYA